MVRQILQKSIPRGTGATAWTYHDTLLRQVPEKLLKAHKYVEMQSVMVSIVTVVRIL